MKKKIQKWLIATFFGLLTILATSGGWLKSAELLAQDFLYQSKRNVDSKIIIIAIDKQTTDAFGGTETSWSRTIYSSLIRRLYGTDKTPAVVAFYSPMYWASTTDAIGDNNFVYLCKDVAQNVVTCSHLETNTVSLPFNKNSNSSLKINGITMPYGDLPLYTSVGFSNLLLDSDGYIRYYLPAIDSSFGHADSFSLAVYNAYNRSMGNTYPSTIKQESHYLYIDYVNIPGSYETISMLDVLNGKFSSSKFENRIVIIGSISDTYNVPISRSQQMSGVEIQANIIQSLLEHQEIVAADPIIAGILMGLIITLFLGLILNKRPRVVTISYGFMVLLFIGICCLMMQWGKLLPITYFLVILLLSFLYYIISKYMYIRAENENELQELLYSMAEAMTQAIDTRTPYNAIHTRNVVTYCMELAHYMQSKKKRRLKFYSLSKSDMDQLRMAALLHDVGKLVVPIEILDKPNRLGYRTTALWDKWDRFRLHYRLACAEGKITKEQYQNETLYLTRAKDRLIKISFKNSLDDEDIAFVEEVHSKQLKVDTFQAPIPYLSEDEFECLTIRNGTLTKEEMEQTHDHVRYTEQILKVIKFGRNYNHVQEIASQHHEFLNGTGYPHGLTYDMLSVSTRILTICDIFDALTADDRPYKVAKTRQETFAILDKMAAAGQVDEYILKFAKELWLPKTNM